MHQKALELTLQLQLLSKGHYVELDEHVHSKNNMGVPKAGIYSQRNDYN